MHRFVSLLCFSLSCFLTGCASVSISEEEWTTGPVPEKIYVRPYKVGETGLRVDRDGEELKDFQKALSVEFAERLVERLNKDVLPASLLQSGTKVPRGPVWILEGEFLRINQGSRALRSVIGWGLGGTKMESVTRVYDIDKTGRQREVGRIVTTGGSNAEPGAVFSGPFGAAPRLVLSASLTGVSADARRTSRMITAALSERLAAQGATLRGEPLRAKRLQAAPDREQASGAR